MTKTVQGVLPLSGVVPAEPGRDMLDAAGGLLFLRGRVALYAALQAMDIKPGDEVIVPGFTCVVVPNAVLYLGAIPIFVDIDQDTFNINPRLVEAKITSRTKAIVAQHTFGIPTPMDDLAALAAKHGLYLIEDSAHAIGSVYKGRTVGSMGDVAFFSCQWSKPVTAGLGGWAVVNNPSLLDKMKAIHASYRRCTAREILQLKMQYLVYSALYKPSVFWFAQRAYRLITRLGLTIGSASWEETEGMMPPGYAAQMSPWQEKVLTRNLVQINELITHRLKTASAIRARLTKHGIEPFVYPDQTRPVLLRYPLAVRDKPAVLREARRKRIELGDWFISPVHPLPNRWEMAGYQKGMCPVAEDVANHLINLPTHLGIGDREVEAAVDLVAKWI